PKKGPALTCIANHLAEHIGECRTNAEKHNHLNHVRERVGILVGMSRVCVEETAAIRAQHLDGELRSQRALGDRLAPAFQSLDCLIRLKILNAALRNKKQSGENTNRKQDIECPT